jgi:hypothetical protein
MYLPIPSQPDCASAWREAVRAVDGRPGHAAYNVIIDIADPIAHATLANPGIAVSVVGVPPPEEGRRQIEGDTSGIRRRLSPPQRPLCSLGVLGFHNRL